MFTYSGWNAASYVAEEIKDPGRNVPQALGARDAGGHRDLSAVERAVSLRAAGRASSRRSRAACSTSSPIGSSAPAPAMSWALVSIISLAASISAMTFAGPRVYYAMARDGLFVRPASRIHPRYRTPAIAIGAQALWSGLLVLSGSATTLTTYTGFAVVLFAGIAVSTLFVLRHREPIRRASVPRLGISDRAGDLHPGDGRDRRKRAVDGPDPPDDVRRRSGAPRRRA